VPGACAPLAGSGSGSGCCNCCALRSALCSALRGSSPENMYGSTLTAPDAAATLQSPHRRCKAIFLVASVVVLTLTLILGGEGSLPLRNESLRSILLRQRTEGAAEVCSILFLADLHVEPYFVQYGPADPVSGQCRRAQCAGPTPRDSPDATACVSELDETANIMPRIGCDPPISLLHSALQYATRQLKPPPCAVIIGGDLVAHGLWGSVATLDEIQRKVMRMVDKAFPDSAVLFVVGNNDLAGHGVVTPAELQRLWLVSSGEYDSTDGPSELQQLLGSAGKNSFMDGGYFRADVSASCGKNLSILALNTQLFLGNGSSLLSEDTDTEGGHQLDWFLTQLEESRAAGQRVIVVGHVPPGIFFSKTDWLTQHQERFVQICDEYAETIVTLLFGHHSKELIRGLTPSTGALVTLGLTPMGGHSNRKSGGAKVRESVNPGFGQLMYDGERAVGYRAHYLNLQVLADRMRLNETEELSSAWGLLYDFREMYGVPDVSAASIWQASRAIMSDNILGAVYKSMARGFMSSLSLHQMMCDAGVSTLDDEALCMARRCKLDATGGCTT
jgi:hypothetical protein